VWKSESGTSTCLFSLIWFSVFKKILELIPFSLEASKLEEMQQKPVLSLKQFMLRGEVLKLYRGFLRLGKYLNDPPTSSHASPPKSSPATLSTDISQQTSHPSPSSPSPSSTMNPMREEWNQWVRAEFRLRQASSTDEEATRTLLAHGRRQLQELERTIMLATNRNKPSSSSEVESLPNTSCRSSQDTKSKSPEKST